MKRIRVILFIMVAGSFNGLIGMEVGQLVTLAILKGEDSYVAPGFEALKERVFCVGTELKNTDVVSVQPGTNELEKASLPAVLRLRGGGAAASEIRTGCSHICMFLGWACCCGCCCKTPCNKPCENFDR